VKLNTKETKDTEGWDVFVCEGIQLARVYRVDYIVENCLILELK
jgi:hypothetical protein